MIIAPLIQKQAVLAFLYNCSNNNNNTANNSSWRRHVIMAHAKLLRQKTLGKLPLRKEGGKTNTERRSS